MSWQTPQVQRVLVPLAEAFKVGGAGRKTRGYELQKDGLFTKPVKVGRLSFIPSDELDQIVAARIAGKSDDEVRKLVDQLHAKRAVGYQVL